MRKIKELKAINKNPVRSKPYGIFGGPERIRTAVEAFAELCLTTRPQDLLLLYSLYTYFVVLN